MRVKAHARNRAVGLRSCLAVSIIGAALGASGCGDRKLVPSDASAETAPADDSEGDVSTGSQGEEQGGVTAPLTDCRPVWDSVYIPACTQTWGATKTEAWNDVACGACVCFEPCTKDADCIERDAPVLPTCVTPTSNPDVSLCLLVCDADADCPADTVCLPSEHVAENACYFLWEKPQCCESGFC